MLEILLAHIGNISARFLVMFNILSRNFVAVITHGTRTHLSQEQIQNLFLWPMWSSWAPKPNAAAGNSCSWSLGASSWHFNDWWHRYQRKQLDNPALNWATETRLAKPFIRKMFSVLIYLKWPWEISKENLRKFSFRSTWLAASKNYLEIPLSTRNGPEHKKSVPYNK